jgi:hypothetical protein
MAELERLVAACRHRVRQRAYEVLTCQLNEAQREALDVTSPVPGPDATDPPGLDPRIGWHAKRLLKFSNA